MGKTKRNKRRFAWCSIRYYNEYPWRKNNSESSYSRANKWIKKLTNKKSRKYPYILQNKLYRLLYDRDWTIW